MKIDKYNFGSITINGKEYTKDVIIFPDNIFCPWWREEGHSLSLRDLKNVVELHPSLLIVGTGAYGVMKVPEKTIKELKEIKIKVIIAKTGEAVKLYNEKHKEEKSIIACLHLTC